MNDKDIRLECLRLAQYAAMMAGEKRSVMEIVREYYAFLWNDKPPA